MSRYWEYGGGKSMMACLAKEAQIKLKLVLIEKVGNTWKGVGGTC